MCIYKRQGEKTHISMCISKRQGIAFKMYNHKIVIAMSEEWMKKMWYTQWNTMQP